jgi:cytochrome c oxidase assembly protein subunit 11
VTLAIYFSALAVGVGGLSYAAVPLYKAFCQATGYGGTTQKATEEKFRAMRPVAGARQVTVHFNADTAAGMPWRFTPQQRSARVVPGETALAFYTAHNPTDRAVTGVSTYNITPMKAGAYFNKIQCFCFEEQRLRPHEEIDMPVFFYIDPKFLDDPAMDNVQSLTLSYTFFRSDDAREVMDIADELSRRDPGKGDDSASAKIAQWRDAQAKKLASAPAVVPAIGSGGAAPATAPGAAPAAEIALSTPE